jgi:hypothetical protein
MHQRVFHEDVFDFGGRDVFAAPDDRVIRPSADEEVAGIVEHGDVLRGEPAVGVEHGSDLGVAARHLVAPDEQLTGFAGADDLAVLAADLYLDAGDRLADRTESTGDRHVGRSHGLPVIVGCEHRDGRTGFGESVGVDETDIG